MPCTREQLGNSKSACIRMSVAAPTSNRVQGYAQLTAHGVRERLVKRWQQHALPGGQPAGEGSHFVSPQQQALFALCASYKDVLCTSRPLPSRWAAAAAASMTTCQCIQLKQGAE